MENLSDKELIQKALEDLNLSAEWWKSLLGQPLDVNEFDEYKAADRLPRTELDAARAIKLAFGHALTFTATDQRWYIWDGRIHRPCETEQAAREAVVAFHDHLSKALAWVHDTAVLATRGITGKEKGQALKDSADRFREARAVRSRLATDAGIKAVTALLRGEAGVAGERYTATAVNAPERRYFVVRNGVIDLEQYRSEGKPTLLPHDPSRPVYRYFDADFKEGHTPEDYPNWRHYLSTSIVDWETACLLQKGVGAAFSAAKKPRALFNLLGEPQSGKSMFLTVFTDLGQGYSEFGDRQAVQLLKGELNPYREDLRGKRFMAFSEVQGKPLDDAFIKGVMGGDPQKTRGLYAKQSGWMPQGVMFIASNKVLDVDTRDDATFGKVLPIWYPHTFTKEDPSYRVDIDLEEKILGERDGLLHWVLQGMARYWAEGLDPTAAVLEKMDENKTKSSYALTFIKALLDEGYLEHDPTATTSHCLPVNIAFTLFSLWADDVEVKNKPGKTSFTADIANAYHGQKKSGVWTFAGLRMSKTLKEVPTNPVLMKSVLSSMT